MFGNAHTTDLLRANIAYSASTPGGTELTPEHDGEYLADTYIIDMADNYAMRYCVGRFGCSVDDIEKSVAVLGPKVASVQSYLKDKLLTASANCP